MKNLTYSIAFLILNLLAGNMLAQQGTLDPTFNGNGILILAPTTLADLGDAAVIMADSSIVFGGMATFTGATSTSADILVGRLHPDGTLDTGFGTNGYVIFDYAGRTDYVYDVDLQPDGKIVVTGSVGVSAANWEFMVMRLNADGSYDTTFASTGMAVIPLTTGEEYARAAVIQPDGKIAVGGVSIQSTPQGPKDMATLFRLSTDGILDTTFGNAGFAQSTFLLPELEINDFVIRPNGNYFCVGEADGNTGQAFSFTSAGLIDSAFGYNGFSPLINATRPKQVELYNNFYYITATAGGSSAPVGIIYSVDDTGSYNNAFGNMGKVEITTINTGVGVGYNALRMQPDGKILAAGGSLIVPLAQSDALVSRFLNDGTLDNTFGVNGHFTMNLGGGTTESLQGLALQPDGKVVGIGVKNVSGSSNDIAFVRLDAFSSQVGITELNDHLSEVIVYPNPASDYLQVALPVDAKVVTAEVIAATGAISNVNLKNNNSIDLRGFSKGIYVLRIQTAAQNYVTRFAIE